MQWIPVSPQYVWNSTSSFSSLPVYPASVCVLCGSSEAHVCVGGRAQPSENISGASWHRAAVSPVLQAENPSLCPLLLTAHWGFMGLASQQRGCTIKDWISLNITEETRGGHFLLLMSHQTPTASRVSTNCRYCWNFCGMKQHWLGYRFLSQCDHTLRYKGLKSAEKDTNACRWGGTLLDT